MNDVKTELEAWCASYIAAFSAYDAVGIEAHWAFPALILQSGRRLSFKSAEHFTANTSGLLGFYERQGVAKAVRDVTGHLVLNDETVSMTVADRMVDKSGETIVAWTAAYVLQKTDNGWRAIMAAADGETAAWAARGTPLGS